MNFARSGNRKGRHGKTGGMYIQIANGLLFCLPMCFVHKMSDFAEQVNGSEEVAMFLERVKAYCVVYKRIVKMGDYGDPCHRKRLVLVDFKRTFPGVYEWETPAPLFHSERPHCARDIACDDAD